MRGVGGEALLGVEAPLEPVEHPVEGRGQAVYLVPPSQEADAGREVRAVVYGVDGVRYLAHGLEGVAGDEPAYDGGYDDEHGQEYEREYGYDARGGEVVVRRRDAAQPHAAVVVGHEEVVDEVLLPLHRHRAYLAVAEAVRAREDARPRPAYERAVRAVDLDVDVVPVEVQLVEVEVAVLVLYVVYLVVHGVYERALRAPRYHAPPGYEYRAEHEAHYEQHHEREIYRHARLYGEEPHASSLSTQPTPRTVWMSFLSWPASIFRRR